MAAVLLVPALAQSGDTGKSTPDTTKGHWGPGDRLPDKWEVGIFGGASFFDEIKDGLGTKLHDGGAFGVSATQNFWDHVGIRESFTYRVNNLTFLTPNQPGLPNYGFGQRLYDWGVNPLVYFTKRGSRIRPYATAGAALFNFTPTSKAKDDARSAAFAQYGAQNLNSILLPALTYGAGVKFHFADHWSLDAEGLASYANNPTFKLPRGPVNGSVYIINSSPQTGIKATLGLSYHWGQKAVWVAEERPPEAPKPLEALAGGTLSAGGGTLCQGKAITVRSMGANDPAGRGLVYKWKVNGQPAGTNSPELTFTPDRAGNYQIELDVEAPNNATLPVRTASANTLTLGVQEYRTPTVSSCQAVPAELNYGDSSKLNATTTGSACSTITFKWTASEGTVTDDTSANATFDSKSVRFDQGGKIQAKTVSIAGKVTDDRGASANCDTSVKVNFVPAAIRYGDIIFSKGSARVNNCGKRILLEELAPKAADPDYDIVLIGHYDGDEAPKTKAQQANSLDKLRVLNAIAVLTGGAGKSGQGTCANVDKTRVKADWTADQQVDDKQPGLCGTSARAATKERRGSAVSTADENRRVEVWLVPKGTKLPAGFKNAQDLTTKEIDKQMKTLSCPK